MLDLIGVTQNDGALIEFLNHLDPSYDQYVEEKKYSDCTYWNIRPLGISLLFKPNHEPKLDSIIVYNEGVDKFKAYQGNLPLGLTLKQNNVDIVKKLGEPDKKGGHNIPVWISYETKSKLPVNNRNKFSGLQFDFANKSFEDLNNPIRTITFFEVS
jgi:hypothetical protein